MKKILPLLLLLAACGNEPNMNAAKSCAESYLEALKTPDFEKAGQYYSSSYGSGNEDRIDKMKKLHDLMGEVISWQLTDSSLQTETGEAASITLTYKVKHKKVTTEEKFIIAPDEGQHRIIGQFVENYRGE
jgi:hypothetical protein